MLYRVKQFIWAIKSLFQEVDNDYVNKLLDKREKGYLINLKNQISNIVLELVRML